MNKFFNVLASCAMISLVAASCGKDPKTDDPTPGPGPDTTDVQAPSADFTYKVDGATVTFTNTSSNATSYLWDFGDGEKSSEKSPVYTYSAAGDYTVVLTAGNAAGAKAKKEATISIVGEVSAYFSYIAQKDRAGKFGKVIEFDATSSENAESIAWDFGDGNKIADGKDFKINHEFADYGEYTVKATVKNAGGEDVYEIKVAVEEFNELLKGGLMEAEDAQYWQFKDFWVAEDYETPIVGTPCFIPEFGTKTGGPAAGTGACLRLNSDNQLHDWPNNVMFYQPIEIVEGDELEITGLFKWADKVNDNGVVSINLAKKPEDFGEDGKNTEMMFLIEKWSPGDGLTEEDPTYWWPAYEGNLSGKGLEEWGYRICNYTDLPEEDIVFADCAVSEEGVLTCSVKKSGTYYFGVAIRSVYGLAFGPGHDYYVDDLSVKVNVK